MRESIFLNENEMVFFYWVDVEIGREAGDFLYTLYPGHSKIDASRGSSDRELPIKVAEFAAVYRWEQSGELSGMTRVRGFMQDDAHILCTEEQLPGEIAECLGPCQDTFCDAGHVRLQGTRQFAGTQSDKYIGGDVSWSKAERALEVAEKSLGVPHSLESEEAAFYDPKKDFIVKDVIEREWQLGTVQVDYNVLERFNISYVSSDNKLHQPMIHRAPVRSMERFCGILIEHFAGDFPTWLAPEQVRLLSLNDENRSEKFYPPNHISCVCPIPRSFPEIFGGLVMYTDGGNILRGCFERSVTFFLFLFRKNVERASFSQIERIPSPPNIFLFLSSLRISIHPR
jgi:hypothetical protein